MFRRKEDLQKALQAETLAAKWHRAFSNGFKNDVPLPFRLYFVEASHKPAGSYETNTLFGWLLIRLFDTCPNLLDIYEGRSLPTPRAMLDAVIAAREEYHFLVELSPAEIARKAPPLFSDYARRAAKSLELGGASDGLDIRDEYISDRAIDILWDKGFFHPVGYTAQNALGATSIGGS